MFSCSSDLAFAYGSQFVFFFANNGKNLGCVLYMGAHYTRVNTVSKIRKNFQWKPVCIGGLCDSTKDGCMQKKPPCSRRFYLRSLFPDMEQFVERYRNPVEKIWISELVLLKLFNNLRELKHFPNKNNNNFDIDPHIEKFSSVLDKKLCHQEPLRFRIGRLEGNLRRIVSGAARRTCLQNFLHLGDFQTNCSLTKGKSYLSGRFINHFVWTRRSICPQVTTWQFDVWSRSNSFFFISDNVPNAKPAAEHYENGMIKIESSFSCSGFIFFTRNSRF